MKFSSALLHALAVLSLAACSKDDSGGVTTDARMDITRFQVESLSEEKSITEADYAAQLKAFGGRSKVCRKSAFGSYKKGDAFVLSSRATIPAQSGVTKLEIVTKETVARIRENEMIFSKVIESMTGVADKSLATQKSVRKCIARNGRVVCQNSSGSSGGSTAGCTLQNKKPNVNAVSTALYALQDGTKIPVLVKRTQSSAEMTCKTGAAQNILVSELEVLSNSVKSFKGTDCALGSKGGEVYGYALLQKENGDLIAESDTRVLLAPAK